MGDSKIEWTDWTWNPVTGCTKVSQGCKNCYAERLWPKVSAAEAKRAGKEIARPFTEVRVHPERLEQVLHIRKPKRIFVNSMSDLFHEDVPNSFIAAVFCIMASAHRHSFQILTKRPQRMLEWFRWIEGPQLGEGLRQCLVAYAGREVSLLAEISANGTWPLRNVWLGVSVEDQATADERIPLLLQTPAAVRWISAEPLLGPIDLTWFSSLPDVPRSIPLDWVVAGGESGPDARPPDPKWFSALRDQCAAAGIPFLFKQWGEWVSLSEVEGPGSHHYFADGSGVRRTGKKLAGRTLDGRVHDEYPATNS